MVKEIKISPAECSLFRGLGVEEIEFIKQMHQDITLLVMIRDDDLRSRLLACLEQCHFDLIETDSIHMAYRLLDEESVDLLMVDSSAKGLNEFIFIETLRQNNIFLPTVFVGEGCFNLHYRLKAFEEEIDDCISPEVSDNELLHRITVLLKRAGRYAEYKSRFLKHRQMVLDIDDRQMWIGDLQVILTRQEHRMLCLAFRQPHLILSFPLMQEYGIIDSRSSSRSFATMMRRLRKKLHHNSDHPVFITVRGVGYRLY